MNNSSAVSLGMPSWNYRAELSTDDKPSNSALIDRYGRIARDLRVSITEKCSLRCRYCMPADGLPSIPVDQLLNAGEIARLVSVAVHHLGIKEVRFTGGEPLMRVDLAEIIEQCAHVAPGVPLSMTTNAVGLEHRASDLANAGLTRINVSLDTIDPVHFAALTRRDRLPSVLAGIRAAKRAGFSPIKVNAVLMGETLSGAVDLLSWCLSEGVSLRFIEQMPLDAEREWTRMNMVSARELRAVLSERYVLHRVGREDPSAPSEEWGVDGTSATVGIIASVTESFCGECDRTRLTAEGTVRPCLFSDHEVDLRSALRHNASDAELAEMWRGAMWNKSAGHGIAESTFLPPRRSMGGIGG